MERSTLSAFGDELDVAAHADDAGEVKDVEVRLDGVEFAGNAVQPATERRPGPNSRGRS